MQKQHHWAKVSIGRPKSFRAFTSKSICTTWSGRVRLAAHLVAEPKYIYSQHKSIYIYIYDIYIYVYICIIYITHTCVYIYINISENNLNMYHIIKHNIYNIIYIYIYYSSLYSPFLWPSNHWSPLAPASKWQAWTAVSKGVVPSPLLGEPGDWTNMRPTVWKFDLKQQDSENR